MESLGRFPRAFSEVPREHIEGPPWDYLRANPRPHPRVWLRMQPRVCQKKITRKAFNILLRDLIEYSRDLPRGSIHNNTSKAFPQIVILSRSRTTQVKQTNKQY